MLPTISASNIHQGITGDGRNLVIRPTSDDALAYAAAGWKIFPCIPGSKAPATANGFYDATTDPDQIRAWFKRNPGANIGLAMKSNGLVPVDLDPRNGGPDRDGFQEQFGVIPKGAVEQITPSGGRHIILRRPGQGVDIPGTLGAGIDAGVINYVLVAPSYFDGDADHPYKGSYVWDGIGAGPEALRNVPEIPLRWLSVGKVRAKGSGYGVPLVIEGTIRKGIQHDALISLGGSARNAGCNYREILAFFIAVNRRLHEPAPRSLLVKKAKSLKYEPAASMGLVGIARAMRRRGCTPDEIFALLTEVNRRPENQCDETSIRQIAEDIGGKRPDKCHHLQPEVPEPPEEYKPDAIEKAAELDRLIIEVINQPGVVRPEDECVRHAAGVSTNRLAVACEVNKLAERRIRELAAEVTNPELLAEIERHLNGVKVDASNAIEEATSKPVTSKLRWVDGLTVFDKQHPPTEFVVNDLLTVGSTMFAGRPKVGKSWFALQLAISVSTGRDFLGHFKVNKPGRVVYLSLEDPERRSTQRLHMLLAGERDANLKNVDFIYDIDPMMAGGLEQLGAHLEARPASLVIIDTWFGFLGNVRKSQRDIVRADYEEVTAITKLANRLRIAVVTVNHTRKMAADYKPDAIQGTTGVTGGIDGSWTIERKTDGTCEFQVNGSRDFEESVYSMKLDNSPVGWQITGSGEAVRTSAERMDILELLREAGELSGASIAHRLRKNENSVRKLCRVMAEGGLLLKQAKGYVVAEGGTWLLDGDGGDAGDDRFLDDSGCPF